MAYRKIYLIILALFFIIFCIVYLNKESSISNPEWEKYSSEYIKKHLNTSIVYPDSVKFEKNDSVISQNVKILFSVDMDCSVCRIKFAFWNEFCENMFSKYKIRVPIMAYVSGVDRNIDERVEKEWDKSWAYDKNEEFVIKNNLFDDRFQAVLVDQNNVVKLIGNPMHNPDLAKLYEKIVLMYFKEK